jgi:N-methylhydantoinase B
VVADVLGGFVRREAAAKHYGVVVTGHEVDQAGTARLRATRTPVKAFHRNEYVDALD